MKILTAIDFSTATEAVLKVSSAYAKELRAGIYLIHVESPEPVFIGYEPGPQTVRDQVALDMKTEHIRLQKDARALEKTGIKVTPLLLQGPPGEMIAAEAVRLGADLIIIGSHGHGALHKMLVGSTSESVLRKAKIPVLVVPVRE
jgi:nucleotide-binding universal stress UspA family protein